jgi:uncharacterized membrane protein YGL010W
MKLLNLASIVVILCLYAIVIFTAATDWELTANDGWKPAWSKSFLKEWYEPLYNIILGLMLVIMALQTLTLKNPLDLKEQFSFYASYHDNTVNKIIHVFFVWPILLTGLVFYSYTFLGLGTLIFGVFYAIFYMALDSKAGTVAAALVMGGVYIAYSMGQMETMQCKAGACYQWALYIHAGAWIAQFVGHGIFEGRAPALLDNLSQSFLMAPLFVLLEVFFLCGYRQDFQDEVELIVKSNIDAIEYERIGAGD